MPHLSDTAQYRPFSGISYFILMGTILFPVFYRICYHTTCVLRLAFWPQGMWGVLAPQPGIEPTPSTLEGGVLNH